MYADVKVSIFKAVSKMMHETPVEGDWSAPASSLITRFPRSQKLPLNPLKSTKKHR